MSSAELVASPCAPMTPRSHQVPAAMSTAATWSAPRPRRGTTTVAAATAPTTEPAANGASVRPAWTAEKCSPNCRYRVSASRVPAIPAKKTTTQASPAL